jgi:selenide,water dikinase
MLPLENDPNLLVGRETSDDAGVYRLTDEMALVQTIDFITPVVNDPLDFGRIAAANALSDVFAMGGRPLTAMNVVCFPSRCMDKAILGEILRGGLEKIHEGGAVLIGGHSVEDSEIKYGLSVTGLVHPGRMITNAGARPGDALILTKRVGTGVLATAIKAGLISPAVEREAIESMAALNGTAAQLMASYSVHACTDITGFGLLGHALELAVASAVRLILDSAEVPLLPEARELVCMGLVPAGSYANRNYCTHQIEQRKPVDPVMLDLLADPQTSGGLLIALPEDQARSLLADLRAHDVSHAAMIGRVADGAAGTIELA